MCGINGFSWKDDELVSKMNETTKHRGPDGVGVWASNEISFGHNRLAIIDLDQRAAQPMHSADGRYVIIFNGEIYNYKELKKELVGYPYKTESDTEVILAAYQKWGKDCFSRMNGMFAIALWDNHEHTLHLVRDPMGIKPLYYYLKNGDIIFSSEIKGILEHPISRVLNHRSFDAYMRVLYVPGPETLFRNILSLKPGTILTYTKDGVSESAFSYRASKDRYLVDANEVRQLVEDAVRRQLVSDRPVGVFLSGGIDSSAVLSSVAKVQKNISTFSVGFELSLEEQSEKFNKDLVLARQTAHYFGTTHHEISFGVDTIPDILQSLIWHMDQPVANTTILPMYALSSMAKEHVAVTLTGDGGDELFGGYERYRIARFATIYQRLPKVVRQVFNVYSPLSKLNKPVGYDLFKQFLFQKDTQIGSVLNHTLDDSYSDSTFEHYFNTTREFVNDFLRVDRETWLVDEALMRTDRMSMAVGLEARAPLLDLELVTCADMIPIEQKVGLLSTKKVLKEALYGELPAYLFSQPKRGWFSPGAKWLRRSNLQPFFLSVLSPSFCYSTKDLFDWDKVLSLWDKHQMGEYHNNTLWAIIIFQLWAQRFSVGR